MTIQTFTATAYRKSWNKTGKAEENMDAETFENCTLLKAKRQATKRWPYRDGWQVTIWNHEGQPVARKRYTVDIWTH